MASGRTKRKLSPLQAMLRYAGIGALVTVLLCIILSFVMAVIISNVNLPHSCIEPVAYIILGASALVGGIVAGYGYHRRALITGALVGIICFVAVGIAGLFVPLGNIGKELLTKLILCVVPAIVGTVIGANAPKKR